MDLRQQTAQEALASLASRMQTPVNEYTEQIVRGTAAHAEQIDETVSTYAEGWALDRMPAVDRAILRLGAFEVLYGADVPEAVAISEAVALATDLSTDESPKFVNGLLGRLAQVKPTLG